MANENIEYFIQESTLADLTGAIKNKGKVTGQHNLEYYSDILKNDLIIPKGTTNINNNGSYSIAPYTLANVNVVLKPPSPTTVGETPVLMNQATFSWNSSSSQNPDSEGYKDTGISITIPQKGSYKFKWWMGVDYPDLNPIYTRLRQYRGGSLIESTTPQSFTATERSSSHIYSTIKETEINNLEKGDVIKLFFKGVQDRYRYYYGFCGMLIACINWDNKF